MTDSPGKKPVSRKSARRVVIIGGGYAGTKLAHGLDGHAEIVLVEPREAFLHNVAAIRAVVDPALMDRVLIAYDRLLKRGRLVRDRVTALEENAVRLSSGAAIEADQIIIATGSTYARPFKLFSDDTASFRTASASAHAKLRAAKSVAIVGAGAVGTELAGEIAAAFPGKSLSLISATPDLFPEFPQGLGRRLQRDLKSMGVTLYLGSRVKSVPDNVEPSAGELSFSDGSTLRADLIFPTMGAMPVTGLMAALPGVAFDRTGRVVVDPWLRPAGLSNVFALGDMAATGEMMTIVGINRQKPWLEKTIKSVLAGKKVHKLPPYTTWPTPPILIPLGPKRGASVLPLTKSGLVVGGFLTSMIKGKTLFVPGQRKALGYV